MPQDYPVIDLRPYQLVEIVAKGPNQINPRLAEAVAAMRRQAYVPIRLRANVSSIYAFQNPGPEDDTPGGADFNTKRDLDLLQRLGLTPGVVMPAIDLIDQLITRVPTLEAIAGYGPATARDWPVDEATAAAYARAAAQGLGSVFRLRAPEEMARVKRESAMATIEAPVLRLRPHHVMCMTCFYGGRMDDFGPIDEDNLYEAVVAIQRNPEVPITLVQGPCMICPPCHFYDPEANLCYLHVGIGLRDERKDLEVLQRLGLKYGDTMPARQFLKLLYERIPTTVPVCSHGDGIERAPSWRVCDGPEGSPRYVRGRAAGLGVVKVD